MTSLASCVGVSPEKLGKKQFSLTPSRNSRRTALPRPAGCVGFHSLHLRFSLRSSLYPSLKAVLATWLRLSSSRPGCGGASPVHPAPRIVGEGVVFVEG